MINLLLDENVALKIKNGLLKKGYLDIVHINDIGKGLKDEEVFTLAKEQNRILISGDDDFKNEKFKYSCGIIWITPKVRLDTQVTVEKIDWILRHIDNYNINTSECFITIKKPSYVIAYKKGMKKQVVEKEIFCDKIRLKI